MRTFMNTRRLSGAAATLVLIVMISLTGCEQGGLVEPFGSTSQSITTTTSLSSLSTDLATDALAHGGIADKLPELEGLKPDAVLSLHRLTPRGTTLANAGEANARFSSTATVSGVSVSVNGSSYTLTALARPSQPSGGRGGHGGPGGHPRGPGDSIPKPGIGLFTTYGYPAPPASKDATPTFIPLPESQATATFTATGYALSANTVSVPGIITVSSHKSGDAVSRSSNLTVRWSVSGSITSGAVVIHPARDSSQKPVGRPANPGSSQKPTPVVKTITAGASSVEFTAAELTTFQAGNVVVEITLANVSVSADKKVAAIGRSGTRLPLVLQ